MKMRQPPLAALLTGTGLSLAIFGAGAWYASTILLRPRKPDPADPPSNYGLDYTEVHFPSRDGTPLHGWWIAPPQPNGHTVVLVHGHNGSMDGDTAQAAALAQAGFRVLLFNLRAHGRSGGNQVTFGAREDLDVFGALDWLAAKHGITRVGLVGFSMGAGVALIAAAQDKHVAAVVADGTIRQVRDGLIGLGEAHGLPGWLVAPFADLLLWIASTRAGIDLRRGDPAHWVSRVACPVLFIHGAADPFTSMRSAGALVAAARHGRLWVLPGAGHRDAYTLDPEAYYRRVVEFLNTHLADRPTPARPNTR